MGLVILILNKYWLLFVLAFLLLLAYFFDLLWQTNFVVHPDQQIKIVVIERTQNYIFGSYKNHFVLINNSNKLITNEIAPGTSIWVSGEFSNIEDSTASSNFSLSNYLSTKHIYQQFNISKIFEQEKSFSLRIEFENYLSNSDVLYRNYINLLLLGKKTSENNYLFSIAKNISILHLFVISGFHIGLFYKLLKWFFSKCFAVFWVNETIIFLIILFYLYLLNFALSALRALVYLFLNVINDKMLKKYFSKLQILAICAILFLIWNWNYIYSLSFVFSFVATFSLIICFEFKFSREWKKYLITSLIVYGSTIAISCYYNQFIAIFGYVFALALTPFIAFSYLIVIFLFPLKTLLHYYFWILNHFMLAINSINLLITINRMNYYLLISYYALFYTSLYEKRVYPFYFVNLAALFVI